MKILKSAVCFLFLVLAVCSVAQVPANLASLFDYDKKAPLGLQEHAINGTQSAVETLDYLACGEKRAL